VRPKVVICGNSVAKMSTDKETFVVGQPEIATRIRVVKYVDFTTAHP
jgi:hypothetical protein